MRPREIEACELQWQRARLELQYIEMKRLACLFILFLCSFAWSEEMYTTFVSESTFSKSELCLKLDEKDVPIDDFLQIDTASRQPDLLTHPAARRQYILLIDLLYLSPSQVLEARKLVQNFLEQIPKEDLIALAGITNED